MVVKGADHAESFLAYTEQCQLPTLDPGDIVVLDSVPFHHDARVDTLIPACVSCPHIRPTST